MAESQSGMSSDIDSNGFDIGIGSADCGILSSLSNPDPLFIRTKLSRKEEQRIQKLEKAVEEKSKLHQKLYSERTGCDFDDKFPKVTDDQGVDEPTPTFTSFRYNSLGNDGDPIQPLRKITAHDSSRVNASDSDSESYFSLLASDSKVNKFSEANKDNYPNAPKRCLSFEKDTTPSVSKSSDFEIQSSDGSQLGSSLSQHSLSSQQDILSQSDKQNKDPQHNKDNSRSIKGFYKDCKSVLKRITTNIKVSSSLSKSFSKIPKISGHSKTSNPDSSEFCLLSPFSSEKNQPEGSGEPSPSKTTSVAINMVGDVAINSKQERQTSSNSFSKVGDWTNSRNCFKNATDAVIGESYANVIEGGGRW